MSNSPLVEYTKISPNHSNGRNHKIDRITPHYVGGSCSIETLGEIFAPKRHDAQQYMRDIPKYRGAIDTPITDLDLDATDKITFKFYRDDSSNDFIACIYMQGEPMTDFLAWLSPIIAAIAICIEQFIVKHILVRKMDEARECIESEGA